MGRKTKEKVGLPQPLAARATICMFLPMRAARTIICLKIGLVPALCAALLPMVVALFHLMPAMTTPMAMPMPGMPMPAMAQAPAHHAAARHDHHHDTEATVALADAGLESPAARDEDCHPPGEPCDDPPRNRGMQCPLCLWLQGLHALPAPVAPGLRLPAVRAVAATRTEAPVTRRFVQSTSQPRAPPISFLI